MATTKNSMTERRHDLGGHQEQRGATVVEFVVILCLLAIAYAAVAPHL